MDKKILIGLLVVAGIYVGYRYINKPKVTAVKKETNDTGMATEKDGYDFYNKVSAEGNWQFSKEGIGRFIKEYPQIVTKANHNKMMAILKNERINRAVTDNQLIDETIDKVVNKLKP
jgi:hypothetical protein